MRRATSASQTQPGTSNRKHWNVYLDYLFTSGTPSGTPLVNPADWKLNSTRLSSRTSPTLKSLRLATAELQPMSVIVLGKLLGQYSKSKLRRWGFVQGLECFAYGSF